MIICLLALSGCRTTSPNSEDRYIALYNGDIYDEVDNWYPVSKDYEPVSAWIGFEDEMTESITYSKQASILKSDTKHIALIYDNQLSDMNYFIKRDAHIPHICTDTVEKIVLVKDDERIPLEKDNFSSYLKFINQCYSDKASYVTDKWNHSAPDWFIYVYFQDFPLYYYYGYFGQLKSGQYGFSSWDFEGYNTHGIALPESISNDILSYSKDAQNLSDV